MTTIKQTMANLAAMDLGKLLYSVCTKYPRFKPLLASDTNVGGDIRTCTGYVSSHKIPNNQMLCEKDAVRAVTRNVLAGTIRCLRFLEGKEVHSANPGLVAVIGPVFDLLTGTYLVNVSFLGWLENKEDS